MRSGAFDNFCDHCSWWPLLGNNFEGCRWASDCLGLKVGPMSASPISRRRQVLRLAVVRQRHVDDFLIRGDDAVKALVGLDEAQLAARELFDRY